MNSNLPIHVASVIALAALTACGSGTINLETAAAPGAPLSAEVSRSADGTYHADRLLVSKALTSSADSEDDDDIECEDGVAPDGSACEDDDDDESADDGEDEDDDDGEYEDDDDVECEDGVAPDGSACEDDDDESADDGEDEDDDDIECEDGVAPDGSACEDDDDEEEDVDEDGDGDVDEDDARYAAGGAPAFINGVPSLIDGRNVYALFGVEINPGGATVPEGAVRFDGGYADGYLAATQTAPGTSALSVGGSSESVAKTGRGTWTIQLLGQTLIVDDNTEIVPVSQPLQGEEEAASDEEDDGIDCEQEGEHEGENEGC